MNDIMKTVKLLEKPGLSIKGVSETITNEEKQQKGGFLRMLLGTLGASLSRNLLTRKGKITGVGGTVRAGQDLLMPSNFLTNFEIKNYQNNA